MEYCDYCEGEVTVNVVSVLDVDAFEDKVQEFDKFYCEYCGRVLYEEYIGKRS